MYLCCVVVYFGSFATGTMLGLSSPVIPDIEASKAKDTPHLNFMNASWFGVSENGNNAFLLNKVFYMLISS